MKAVNNIAKVAVVAVMAFGLIACGKKNNGSAAVAPAATCNYNGVSYVDALGQPCSQTGQTLCPATGVWINQLGQQQACTPGQYISQFPNPGGYPWNYQQNQGISSCQQATATWGIPYVPMILQGQYVCVRYDLLQTQMANYGYTGNYASYGYDYYYAYPPYDNSYGYYGGGCSTSFFFDFGGFGGDICLSR